MLFSPHVNLLGLLYAASAAVPALINSLFTITKGPSAHGLNSGSIA